jgi:hypothetical protein
MAAGEGAAAVIGLLNKVIKYAVGAGVGASVLQTSLFTGDFDGVAAVLQPVGRCCELLSPPGTL